MNKKILIVDDEPQILFLLKTRLAALNYKVLTAKDGIEGWIKFKSEKPDLIILDVLMPNLTGYQLTEQLRELKNEAGHVPVIVISAKHNMRDSFEFSNIFAFLPKPFDPKKLVATVERALGITSEKVPKKNVAVKVRGGGRKVFLAGTEESIIKKIKEYLEAHSFVVTLFFDERQLIRYLEDESPAFVFCQFWENPQQFDSEMIYRESQGSLQMKKIPFIFFCIGALAIDVTKVTSPQNIISYLESGELIYKLNEYLKEHPR